MNEICRTCLSTGRRLIPVTGSHRQMLRWMNVKMKKDGSICWECEGNLSRFIRFRTRAMKAQRTMNLCRGRVQMIQNMESLSDMSFLSKTTYDVTIDAETNTAIKETSHSNLTVHERKQDSTDPLPSTSANYDDFTVDLKVEPKSDNEQDNDMSDNDLKRDFTADDNKSEGFELKKESIDNGDKKENNDQRESNECQAESNDYTTLEIKNECDDDDEWEELMMQPEVVFYDEEKNAQYTKDDFYVMKTMTVEELDAAREADRNGARYKFCPFKCESCILGYYHEDLLNKHLADRHSESASHVCTICQQHFFSEENLEGHHRSHFNGYSCRICGYKHHRYSMMDIHYVKMHKNSSKRCSPCTLYFPNYRMLKYHRETVHRQLPTCAHCGKEYKTKAILKRHLIRHEATEFFECKVCHKSYRGKEGLVDHMRRHEAKTKKSEVVATTPHCAECDMSFKNIASYKNHLHFSLKHKGPEAMSRYTCGTCGKRFQNKPAVQRHVEAIHLSDTVCTLCNKWFTREAKLREHVRFVHEGAQKVKDKICTICGVGFSENRILVGHMRTHTGEKPYSCVHCGASFSQSGTLKAHIRVKHGKN